MNRDFVETKLPHIMDMKAIGSEEIGYLTIAEYPENMPFEIKRVYWTYFTPEDIERGSHAHKKLEQIIIAVAGTIEMNLEHKNGQKFNFILDKPYNGLYIPCEYWRTIKFSENGVLLCLASEKYDKDEYIRNYEEFKNSNRKI